MMLTIHAPIRPGTPRYSELMERHDAAVARWGVRLPRPSADLLARAKAHGEQIREATCRANGWTYTHDARGHLWADKNTHGQVGAELLANYYGTSADWTVHPEPDPGWDLVPPGTTHPLHIDAKTRQAFLTLRDEEITHKADYYALVQQRTKDADFVFCGVMTAASFVALRFPAELERGIPLWAVIAEALTPPAQFHPFAR